MHANTLRCASVRPLSLYPREPVAIPHRIFFPGLPDVWPPNITKTPEYFPAVIRTYTDQEKTQKYIKNIKNEGISLFTTTMPM